MLAFVSAKSLRNSVLINAAISAITYTSQKVNDYFGNSIYIVFGTELFKSMLLIKGMEYRNREKEKIDPEYEIVEAYPNEFNINVLGATVVKACTHYAILNSSLLASTLPSDNIPLELLTFILKSFAFEIVFDFGHYWMHRMLHSNATLYKSIHKKHHKFLHPSADVAFYINPIDLALSYSVPITLAMFVIPLDKSQFMWATAYLTYQEIGGHLGKKMAPTSSFAQCIWLPRTFDIELHTEDHDLHHSHFNYNYSKRFTLWDKVFGTYKQPKSLFEFEKTKKSMLTTKDE